MSHDRDGALGQRGHTEVQKGGAAQSAYGRRFSPAQRRHALVLVASGMEKSAVARVIGATDKTIRTWVNAAVEAGDMPEVPVAPEVIAEVRAASEEASGGANPVGESSSPAALGSTVASREESSASPATKASDATSSPIVGSARSPYAPKDPGQGLADYEVAAILEFKKKHPSYGPAQLRTQLKRFKKWRISIKAITRVLRDHGYETVHRGSRPQGPEPTRFEAPRRNALWQMDFTELRVASERFFALFVLDDFSRYVVGHQVSDRPCSQTAIDVLQNSMARHGKPEAVRTDRGGAFTSAEFKQFLEVQLIDHVIGHAYHPQGGGKVESLIGTVKRELWEVEQFGSRQHAIQRISEFVQDYNERRAHMGIDGLTPADRFLGRADQVLAQLDAISRKRNGTHERRGFSGSVFEETLRSETGAPMEVVRLMMVDGHLELRLCGARVRLGPVTT